MEPGLDGGEHVFHVHIRHGLVQVVDELFEEGFILTDVEIGGCGGHHHGFLLEYQRQVGRKVVAPAGLEFVHEIIAPQLAAVGVGGKLQRVHIQLHPAVFQQGFPHGGGQHFPVPVIDEGLRAVFIDVIDGIVHRAGGGSGLAGALHPHGEQQIIAVLGGLPVEEAILHLAGEHNAVRGQQGALAVGSRAQVFHGHHGDEGLLVHVRLGDFRPGNLPGIPAAGGHFLRHKGQLLGGGPVVGGDVVQIGVGPVGAAGHAGAHAPQGGLFQNQVGVVDKFLGTPAIAGNVDTVIAHGQKFRRAEAGFVQHFYFVDESLVGMMAFREPPAHLVAVRLFDICQFLFEILHVFASCGINFLYSIV